MGHRYRDIEREHDCHFAVVDVRCRYKSPAYYDDEITVRTSLKNVRGSFIHFNYEVVRAGDGTVLAEGESTHIVVNAKFERTTMPDHLQKQFEAAVRL
jgi:acyl-CoA thioester hydrolase